MDKDEGTTLMESAQHADRGAAIGFALGFLPAFRKGVPLRAHAHEPVEPGWLTPGAWLCGLAIPLCLVVGISVGRPWEYFKPPALQATSIGNTGLTISLPQLKSRERMPGEPSSPAYRYGTLLIDPAMVEVIDQRLAAPRSAEALDSELRQEFDRAKTELIQKGMQVTAAPTMEARDGRTSVHFAIAYPGGVMMDSHEMLLGAHRVFVRFYTTMNAPPEWKALAQPIADSLNLR